MKVNYREPVDRPIGSIESSLLTNQVEIDDQVLFVHRGDHEGSRTICFVEEIPELCRLLMVMYEQRTAEEKG